MHNWERVRQPRVGTHPRHPCFFEPLQRVEAVEVAAKVSAELDGGTEVGDRLVARDRLAAAPADAAALRLASQIEDALGDSRAADAYRRRLRAEFPHDASESDAMGHNGAR